MWAVLLLFLLAEWGSGEDQVNKMHMCKRCTCLGGTVDCSEKEMEKHMNSTVWRGMIGVDEFILDHNGIVHLRPFPLFGTRKLSIRHNLIAKIDDAAFQSITNLTELDLSYNHLTSHSLTPHAFKGYYSPESYEPLKSLRVLRLSGNLLHSLNNALFEHLPNLKVLSLDSNPFKIIDLSTSIAISSAYQLEVLDLSSTMLTSFPNNVLHSPKSLLILNMSSNYFTEIPEALAETQSLQEFIIDDNPITNLRNFPSVPTLRVLKMNRMPVLKSIESKSLSKLTGLEEFHCSHNRHLKRIDGDTFKHKPEGLAEAPTWPPLRKLYMSYNDFGYLDFGLLSRWDKLEQVDVQMNPWVCDCNNEWILNTLIPVVQRTNASLAAGILCLEPPELEDTPMMVLSSKHSKMRCLDMYGNRPEKDSRILISIFVCVMILIPIAMAAIVVLHQRLHRRAYTGSFRYKNIVEDSSSHI